MLGRVLIVEDDKVLATVLADNLRLEGYDVDSTGDGNDALTRLRSFQPDLVLLDVTLPNRSGFELCGVLRQRGRVAVIMLSARGQKADRLRGLQLGADDYITKPFDLDELLLRIQSVLRRSRHAVETIALGEVTVNFRTMRAQMGARELHLTHLEFEVLGYLAARRDSVVHRDELLREIWGYLDLPPTTRSVDHIILRLRKKIERDPRQPRFIRTVHGDGYRLMPDGDAS